MGLFDLHIHSIHSFDATGTIPAILKHVADNTNLDVIAITDHDSVSGNRLAMQLAPQYGLQVIPGCEVSTGDGHLLTLFIKEIIPPGLSLVESVRRVRDQGGLCIVPHPEAWGLNSIRASVVNEALQREGVAGTLVGIESYNGGLVYPGSREAVLNAANQTSLTKVGNSDSHSLETIGEGSTEFPGNSIDDLKHALINGTTTVHEAAGWCGIPAFLRWIPIYALRRLGWVTWNSSPEEPLIRVRAKQLELL